MDASMINKIQKSIEYATEPDRVTFHTLEVEFRGDNSSYESVLGPDGWSCSCPGFEKYGICPHIMTLEKLFKPMLKRDPLPYATGQNIVSDVKKSARYSDEPERIRIVAFSVSFRGDNKEHHITYQDGTWDNPTSAYFVQHGISTHVMTVERVLRNLGVHILAAQMPRTEVE